MTARRKAEGSRCDFVRLCAYLRFSKMCAFAPSARLTHVGESLPAVVDWSVRIHTAVAHISSSYRYRRDARFALSSITVYSLYRGLLSYRVLLTTRGPAICSFPGDLVFPIRWKNGLKARTPCCLSKVAQV